MGSGTKRMVTPKGACELLQISKAAFWRNVRAHRLPNPVYPSPRTPRWFEDELIAFVKATRAAPREALATRLAEKRKRVA